MALARPSCVSSAVLRILKQTVGLGVFGVCSSAWAADAVRLETITVTSAAAFEQSLSDAPASISVVTREDLEQKRFSNLAEALADIPGVDVRAGTGKTGGLNIGIRGMPSEYTLILIDGRRQNTSGNVTPNGFGETATSFLPPVSAIERIEVIRGPMSTLYGSDAMGGVINIITRPVSPSWGGTLNVENTFQEDRSAGNSSSLSLFATGPVVEDQLGLQLRGRLLDRDASERLIANSAGRDPRPPEARVYTIGARLSYTPDTQQQIWLDVDRARQTYSNENCRLGTLDGTNRTTCEPQPGTVWGYANELRFNRDQLAIGHRAHLSDGTLESRVTHNTTETLGRTLPAGQAPDYGYMAEGGEPRLLENRDLVVDSQWIMPLADHMLTLGGQYVDSRLEDGAAGQGAFEQHSWAMFAENEWWFSDAMALTLGLRYEHHKAFSGHLSPRAYLVWNPHTQWTLKGGVSQGYKAPTLNQLHDGITGFTNQGRTITIGSPHLEPEKSTNYELGASFAKHSGLSMDITLFHTRFNDLIASGAGILNCQYVDAQGNTPYAGLPGCLSVGNFTEQEEFAQSVNLDRARSQGVELSARYRFAPAWEISGGYTYTDTQITSGIQRGLVLTNTPEHAFNARLHWDVTERLVARLDGEVFSSRERFAGGIPTSGQNLSLYQQLGNKLQGYEVFNLGASYHLSERVRLNATVYNLLDKDFGTSDTYVHAGQTFHAYHFTHTGAATDGVYLDRRNLWLSAVYDF